MSNILQYKGYRATIVYRAEDCILYGKIEGIKDLVNFQATSTEDVEKEFHCAVDDYLALCAELGEEPDKPYSGTFNVRVTTKLHRDAAMFAIDHGMTLNQVVETAMEKYIDGSDARKVEITVNVNAKDSVQIPHAFTEKLTSNMFVPKQYAMN